MVVCRKKRIWKYFSRPSTVKLQKKSWLCKLRCIGYLHWFSSTVAVISMQQHSILMVSSFLFHPLSFSIKFYPSKGHKYRYSPDLIWTTHSYCWSWIKFKNSQKKTGFAEAGSEFALFSRLLFCKHCVCSQCDRHKLASKYCQIFQFLTVRICH